MTARPAELTSAAISAFARDPGRSAAAIVRSPAGHWSGGVADHVPRPAASLLKLGIAMAAERALQHDEGPIPGQVRIGEILGTDPSPSALRTLHEDITLRPADVLGLMISLSDNPCATWLLAAVGPARVRAALSGADIHDVHVAEPAACAGPIRGRCTAGQALALAIAAGDASRHPLTAAAMEHVVHAARIPIGVQRADIRVAHKTGSLTGVANDVAVIDCHGAEVLVAFLTEQQHDPLVTGHEMGLCTRRILDAWGLGARTSRSFASP